MNLVAEIGRLRLRDRRRRLVDPGVIDAVDLDDVQRYRRRVELIERRPDQALGRADIHHQIAGAIRQLIAGRDRLRAIAHIWLERAGLGGRHAHAGDIGLLVQPVGRLLEPFAPAGQERIRPGARAAQSLVVGRDLVGVPVGDVRQGCDSNCANRPALTQRRSTTDDRRFATKLLPNPQSPIPNPHQVLRPPEYPALERPARCSG